MREIIFAIFIFAISNEPTFELGDQIKRMIMTDDNDSCM